MSDIELVIKIPKEAKQTFDNAESNELKCGFYDHGGVIASAIRNGKVLPKGHGRLIDESKIKKCGWNFIDHHAKTDAPTIIEADKGEE